MILALALGLAAVPAMAADTAATDEKKPVVTDEAQPADAAPADTKDADKKADSE